MPIDGVNLRGLDLNLLVSFEALLAERNVTRAAAKVGIGQSAMSSALSRLRVMFGDELLTRAPDGMRPTPRAAALAGPLAEALARVSDLVRRSDDFDPATERRTFSVALPASTEALLGPTLLARIGREAPGVSLLLRSVPREELADAIDAGIVDLAVTLYPDGRAHHKRRLLYSDGYQCLFNADLLGIASPVSLEDYLRFPHVLTSLKETAHGVVDDALAPLGRTRRIGLTTPRFLTVPYVVRDAPMLATMHARLAHRFARDMGLATSPAPVALPEVTVSLLWHSSHDRDPAHLWLRQAFVEAAAEATPRSRIAGRKGTAS